MDVMTSRRNRCSRAGQHQGSLEENLGVYGAFACHARIEKGNYAFFVFSVLELAGCMTSAVRFIERENMCFHVPVVFHALCAPRYFRTGDDLLWDRRARFDRVFGSGDTRKVEPAPPPSPAPTPTPQQTRRKVSGQQSNGCPLFKIG